MNKKMTLSELWATGVGMCVGSGIMVLIGTAMSITGRSAWLCFGIAVLYGLCMNIPYLFLSKTMVIEGGQYAIAYEFTSKTTAGMFMVLQFMTALGTSLMGVAIGTYVQSVFPAVNATVVALIVLTLFYIINMLGVKSMARVQNIMSWILLATIVVFIIMGFVHGIDPAIFDVSDPEFMTGGTVGFVKAICMMSFSCWGYYCLINYGKSAQKPKQNVAKAMLLTVPTIFVLYVGTAIVNCGVLSLEKGAGSVLTTAAMEIMPMYLGKR